MPKRPPVLSTTLLVFSTMLAASAASDDRVYFSAVDNVTDILVQHINAEPVRLDISSWYLSEHAISIAIAAKFASAVPARAIADRSTMFKKAAHTTDEYYCLSGKSVAIRRRRNTN